MTLVNHLTSDISLLTLQQLFHVVSISHTSYNPSRPSRCMPVYRCMPQQLRLIARLEFLGGALRSSLWMVYLGGQVWHRLCRKASEPAPCSILFHLVPSCSSLFQLVPACSKSLFGSFLDPCVRFRTPSSPHCCLEIHCDRGTNAHLQWQ